MKKWLIFLIIGVSLLLLSYSGHTLFNQGIDDCGKGSSWPPSIFQSALAVCVKTVIPASFTTPTFWLGIFSFILSIILFIVDKIKSK